MTSSAQHTGTLIVLCGPSGVGKSTISRKLAARMRLKYIVSVTTRPPTPHDAHGKAYDHVLPDAFFRRIENDEFLEYAKVYDEWYGTPKRPTLDYLANGEDVLLEIDVQGALQVRFQYADALVVFIMPPDAETLLRRLRERGRDTPEAIEKRFRNAKREIWMAKGSRAFDDMVINDDVDRAVAEVARLIKQKKSVGGF